MAVIVNYVGFHPTLALDGFDYLRRQFPVERIYILYDGKRDRYGAVSRRNAEKLRQILQFFKPIMIDVNPQSFESVFSKVYAILRRECSEKKDVFIDITDMPPEAVSAITMLALMFPSVKVYIVPTDKRGDFIPAPNTPTFEDWIRSKDNKRGLKPQIIDLPGRAVRLFEDEESEKIIRILYEKGGKANSIIQLMRWCGVPNPRYNAAAKNRFSRLIDSLTRKGLVYKLHRGRHRRIELTEFGRVYARALVESSELERKIYLAGIEDLALTSEAKW